VKRQFLLRGNAGVFNDMFFMLAALVKRIMDQSTNWILAGAKNEGGITN
jgi:hypothetical protein